MSTKRYNSEGKLIEELDIEVSELEIVSLKEQQDLLKKINELETLIWCEYYLNSKKNKTSIKYIKFYTF